MKLIDPKTGRTFVAAKLDEHPGSKKEFHDARAGVQSALRFVQKKPEMVQRGDEVGARMVRKLAFIRSSEYRNKAPSPKARTVIVKTTRA